MAKTLIIVESPAKVKTIKKFLGSNYKVEATMGHIRDLPKSTLGIDIENNFEPKYINIRGKGDILKQLRKTAKSCDNVLLATDPDREGEAISWHLANILKIDEDKAKRIEFNEITKTAVTAAIKKPRSINMDLVDAQQARRVLDRIVGYKISPLLWKKVRKGLSAGRVQSVALRMICDREKAINSFTPVEYWTINANVKSEGVKTNFDAKFYGISGKKTDINNEKEAKKIETAIKEATLVVDNIKETEKKRNAPKPFTTSTMQQEAYKKCNFALKKTMMIAQQLYEMGLITYLRTDSTRISEEAKEAATGYITKNYGLEYSIGEQKKANNKQNIQDAHEAIRPSDIYKSPEAQESNLTKDQLKLYKLIWNRFLASQMSSAIFDTLAVDIKADKYTLKANGSIMKFAGFLKVYRDDEDSKNVVLPPLKIGQELVLNKIDKAQHFTEPPARYTEATIVKGMEELGIGRPSTYAPTLTTIMARGYILKEKKVLFPTELGETVIKLLIEFFPEVVNIEFTAQMEGKLDIVAIGEMPWKKVVADFYEPFEKSLIIAEEVASKIVIVEKISDVPCDKCGKLMVYKQGRYGEFLACPGFPECRNTMAIVKYTGVKCPKCDGEIIEKKSKKGKKFFACDKYPDCDFVSWGEPIEEKCPVCGSNLCKQGFRGKETIKCINSECKFVKK